MSLGSIPPEEAAERLVEMSVDVRYAVLVDPAGGLVGASDHDRERARRFAGLAHELVSAADTAAVTRADGSRSRPTDALEAQVAGGSTFMARDARYALVCVARRLALPALVLYDLRQTLGALESPG